MKLRCKWYFWRFHDQFDNVKKPNHFTKIALIKSMFVVVIVTCHFILSQLQLLVFDNCWQFTMITKSIWWYHSILTTIHTEFYEMQQVILPNITGFINTYPVTINWGRTCQFCRNARNQWIQLLITDWIISYFFVIANTDLKITKTMSWKYMISISSKGKRGSAVVNSFPIVI